MSERLFDLAFRSSGKVLLVVVVEGADFGRDREPWRHRQAELGHFGEVRRPCRRAGCSSPLRLRPCLTEGVDPLSIETDPLVAWDVGRGRRTWHGPVVRWCLIGPEPLAIPLRRSTISQFHVRCATSYVLRPAIYTLQRPFNAPARSRQPERGCRGRGASWLRHCRQTGRDLLADQPGLVGAVDAEESVGPVLVKVERTGAEGGAEPGGHAIAGQLQLRCRPWSSSATGSARRGCSRSERWPCRALRADADAVADRLVSGLHKMEKRSSMLRRRPCRGPPGIGGTIWRARSGFVRRHVERHVERLVVEGTDSYQLA